jgi:hypothetical protein
VRNDTKAPGAAEAAILSFCKVAPIYQAIQTIYALSNIETSGQSSRQHSLSAKSTGLREKVPTIIGGST